MRQIILILFSCALFYALLQGTSGRKTFYRFPKMSGWSMMAPRKPIDSLSIDRIVKTGAEYVAVIPYGFTNKGGHRLHYDSQWQWWGERTFGVIKSIELAHRQKLKVMLKPQVWVMNGFTGNLDFDQEEHWEEWEKGYRSYILHFAKIAEKYQVDSYCIGTEFKNPIQKRKAFWRLLIQEVKSLYKGRITYAANWDGYEDFPFWSEMDFIGVNSYFPLTKKKSPTKNDILLSWRRWGEELGAFSKKTNRPIVFTELGYRSMEGTLKKPWDSEMNLRYDEKIQNMAFEVFFEEIWGRQWMKGAFIWKWHPNKIPDEGNNKYSPQGKLAQKTIEKYF